MSKEIKVCKNPECRNEFIPIHKGHSYCCAVCQFAHYKTSGRLMAKHRRFRKTKSGKLRKQKDNKAYRLKHPERIIANNRAYCNIKAQVCEVKDCHEQGIRHHEDYSKPLEVIFMCQKHHVERWTR